MKCPLCLNEVEKLQTNSHIIPRHALIPTKINGKNLSISIDKKTVEKNQTDRKKDIVCANCEKMFAHDDSFAKMLMVDNIFPCEIFDQTENGLIRKYTEIGVSIKRLGLSICIRQHLYDELLGPRFEQMRLLYLNDYKIFEDFHVCVIKIPKLENTVVYPYRVKIDGVSYIRFSFLNHSFIVGTDSRGFKIKELNEALITRSAQYIAELPISLISHVGIDQELINNTSEQIKKSIQKYSDR